MGIELIHRFLTNTLRCYDAYLVRGQQDTLGVLTCAKLADERSEMHRMVELALIDLYQRRCTYIATWNSAGPSERDLTEDALLRYDPVQNRWVIAQLQGGWYHYIGMRTLNIEEDGSPILSPLCLLATDIETLGGMNPLLDLEIRSDAYRFLYHRRFTDHLWVPRIGKTDVRIWKAWDSLEERMSTVRAGDASEVASWQEWLQAIEQQTSTHHKVDHVFLPEQVIFDPHTANASQTSDVEVISQDEVMEAEMAWTMADGVTRLFAFCSPEIRPDEGNVPKEEELAAIPPPPSWYIKLPVPADTRNSSPQWHIWLTGWDRDVLNYQWVYTPQIGVPLKEDLPFGDDPPRPAAYVAALAGPDTASQQPTLVAVVAFSQLAEDVYVSREKEDDSDNEEEGSTGKLITDNENHDEKDEEEIEAIDDENETVEVIWGKPDGLIQSRGVCLTHDGQVVQEVTEPFGLRPSLCRCGELVVGVDQPAEGWRLWNWSATRENRLRAIQALDPVCRHAFVRAEPEGTTFWLIEEMPDGVRVSKRDAATLTAIAEVEFLAGARLVVESRELMYPLRERSLDPQRSPGLIPYQDTLLLLVLNEQGKMELYQTK